MAGGKRAVNENEPLFPGSDPLRLTGQPVGSTSFVTVQNGQRRQRTKAFIAELAADILAGRTTAENAWGVLLVRTSNMVAAIPCTVEYGDDHGQPTAVFRSAEGYARDCITLPGN
jgi:hypothetical protein